MVCAVLKQYGSVKHIPVIFFNSYLVQDYDTVQALPQNEGRVSKIINIVRRSSSKSFSEAEWQMDLKYSAFQVIVSKKSCCCRVVKSLYLCVL